MHRLWIDIVVNSLASAAPIIALVLARFRTDQPWLRRLAEVGIVFLVGSFLWNVPIRYSSLQTATAVEAKTYSDLSQHTHRLLSQISQMIFHASDGWLPTNQTEFFSRQSAELICQELNGFGLAFIIPRITWLQLFAEETQRYRQSLIEIRKREGSKLEPDLINAILLLEDSTLLTIPSYDFESRKAVPEINSSLGPYLCPTFLTDSITRNFSTLSLLFSKINEGENRLGLKQTKLPLPTYSFGVIGTHRIKRNGVDETRRVSFYNYAHGWILSGNEFISENINAIVAIPISRYHCRDVRVGIVNGLMTGVTPGHLNHCNHVKLGFFFVEPVMQVTLYYKGLYSPYNLIGYGDNGEVIDRAKDNTRSYDYKDHSLSIRSMAADIRWVEFGNHITSTLIKGISIR